MRLEDIGFYTLSNERAWNSSISSPLYRCELLLTDRCNFKCPYCRGMREDVAGVMPLGVACNTVKLWIDEGLKNIRFSGGEPTLYGGLNTLVRLCKAGGVERIAISTNGSADFEVYERLIECGVSDFSISLDGCCASVGDLMAGVKGSWDRVIENIARISEQVYTTVGMVFTEDNIEDCVAEVMFADSLGVSDIRVIPSAQYNRALVKLADLDDEVLNKYPILKYRIQNLRNNEHVRGLDGSDCKRCWLMLDDMAVAGSYHFPCIIYLREGGNPVGKVGPNMRQERLEWIKEHDCSEDPICKKNCLDVCVNYNNIASEAH
jgi:molybdenum cofactor biosynthesis enzyme MoaA